MNTINRVVKWSYLKYASIVAGVLGLLMIFNCFGIFSSASSITSGDIFSGGMGVLSGVKNAMSMYYFSFLLLLVLVPLTFIKMIKQQRMDMKVGYLFLGSLCCGFLCEMTIPSLNKAAANLFTGSLESLAGTIQLIGLLMMAMAILQMVGAFLAIKTMNQGGEEMPINLGNLNSLKNINVASYDTAKFVQYLMKYKIDIQFGLNALAQSIAESLNLSADYTANEIQEKFNGLDFLKKKKIMDQLKPIFDQMSQEASSQDNNDFTLNI